MDILWSPNNDDRYLTLGADLSLFKVDNVDEGEPKFGPNVRKISDSTYSTLLTVNTDNHYIKCVAWYPKPQPENLVAVGFTTGKVLLTSLAKSGLSGSNSLLGKEFIPKCSRQCNYLSWNATEPSLLAVGLEKHRSDSCVQIWDVESRSIDYGFVTVNRRGRGLSSSDAMPVKPYAEFGQGEASQSLAWFPKESNLFVTGHNHRNLRIYDLRDCNHPKSLAVTNAVCGVTIDPHSPYRLASYINNQLTIWDTRHFDKPILTRHEGHSVLKLEWSPVRSGILSYLLKDSQALKFFDIQMSSEGVDDLEPAVIERTLPVYGSGQILSSFDWHPHHENRLLTVTATGIATDVKVHERITLSWSPDIYLSWACSKQVMQCHTIKLCREANEDISIRMKRRASRGYGIQSDISKNGSICEEPALLELWSWLHHLKQVSKSDVPSAIPKEIVIQGVASVLNSAVRQREISPGMSPKVWSQIDYLTWQGVDGHKLKGQKKIYRSDERLKALQLTGWGFSKESASSDFIDQLEEMGDYARAAAVSVFTLRMQKAIEILHKGAKNYSDEKSERLQGVGVNLTAVAMALAGYTDEKNTLWKDMCAGMRKELKNPYLIAMFAFLALDDSEGHRVILEDGQLTVIDRVSYACMFMSDQKLLDYINSLQNNLTEAGHLDGILLTGLSTTGVDLLEKYVSITSDVQTACCVLVAAFPNPEIRKDPRVVNWIESYRELLDIWRLWHERAKFDVFLNDCDNHEKTHPQIHASCHFCGKSIGNCQSVKTWNYRSYNMAFHYGGRMPQSHSSVKATMCPGCRKPLPRCALCLINMGTASGSNRLKSQYQQHPPTSPGHTHGPPPPRSPTATTAMDMAALDLAEDRKKLSSLAEWFSWCQSCRHGGHAQHMSEWFQEHTQCPVTGCSCKCNMLDLPLTNVTSNPGQSRALANP